MFSVLFGGLPVPSLSPGLCWVLLCRSVLTLSPDVIQILNNREEPKVSDVFRTLSFASLRKLMKELILFKEVQSF